MEIKEYLHINYNEFDKLAKQLPEVPDSYEVLAYEEMGSDTIKGYVIDSEKEFSKWDKESISKGEFMFNARLILNILAQRGMIPMKKGSVLIESSY